MPDVTLNHFKRAAADIGSHGDNDTLPFDIDNKFIKEKQSELAQTAFEYFTYIDGLVAREAAGQRKFDPINAEIKKLNIFSERLLVPTGPAGFRITTKIHPFWNLYFNGLGVAIAEKHEPLRSGQAHSYRFLADGDGLFDRDKSWRAYREDTLADENLENETAVVIQTDISSFYEHIYHHRLEECVQELFSENSSVAKQIDRFLVRFASSSKRSFGLPVGGQCSRILAELLMSSIDQRLTDEGVVWHRYVDDFTLIASSQKEAYEYLSILSHALADYGLSLNRSKTTILSSKHYRDYVNAQLGETNDEGAALREIDLHYDPYSDDAQGDYEHLREIVQQLDVQTLLSMELDKGQPDTFLVAQVSRTLEFQTPEHAIQLCNTLLSPVNLHSFRASWATIMRGITKVRADDNKEAIFKALDTMLDKIPEACPHLLLPEANCLHYLKAIRFTRTEARAQYIRQLYDAARSETIRRSCIEVWGKWAYRSAFTNLRNESPNLGSESQRMLWRASYDFGDPGNRFRGHERTNIKNTNALGNEEHISTPFIDTYMDWVENDL